MFHSFKRFGLFGINHIPMEVFEWMSYILTAAIISIGVWASYKIFKNSLRQKKLILREKIRLENLQKERKDRKTPPTLLPGA